MRYDEVYTTLATLLPLLLVATVAAGLISCVTNQTENDGTTRTPEVEAAQALDQLNNGLQDSPPQDQAGLVAVRSGQPQWYGVPGLSGQAIYVGYGSGATREQARTQARQEIATQIEANVESLIIIREIDDGRTNQTDITSTVEESTNVRLDNVVDDQYTESGGIHYVRMRFDARPLNLRVVEALGEKPICAEGLFWERTPIGKILTQRFNCVPNISLEYNSDHERWSLLVNDTVFPVYADEIVDTFWPQDTVGNSPAIRLVLRDTGGNRIPNNQLDTETGFLLRVDVTQRGRVFLLTVWENGGTQLLWAPENIVSPGTELWFPLKPEDIHGNALFLAPLSSDNSGKELIVALLCPDAALVEGQFLLVEDAFGDYLQDPNLYRFGELLELLNTGRCHSTMHTALIEHADSL